MADKKENLIKIKQDYNTDLLFAEGKINLEQFLKRRSIEEHERWDEIKYMASKPLYLRSFLSKLPVEIRLTVVRVLYGYSFPEFKKPNQFGGSITDHFKYDKGILEDRDFTRLKARLAIALDMPLAYILKDNPTDTERRHYDFLEYQEFGKRISLEELKDLIVRPSGRLISGYRIESEIDNNVLFKSLNNNLICRVDLHKTFFVVEFHIQSYIGIDIQDIQSLVDYFDNKICRVILSTPLLRESKKLSLIGTYINEQQSKAVEFSNYLISNWDGQQLYPDDFKFEDCVPLRGFK